MVSGEVGSIWFNGEASGVRPNNEYKTFVMGKFKCKNKRCGRVGWGSKRVAIVIKGYPNNGYNAVVFNQRCESCTKLGTLALDNASYVDRVSYRIKKWAGVSVESPYFDPKEGPPHRTDLCEGCKQGVCREAALS